MSHSSSQTEEDHHGAVQPYHVAVRKLPDAIAQLRFWNRRDLVDHQPRGGPEAVGFVRFDGETQQRRIRRIAGECADRNGLGSIEAIVLDDHNRSGLACVASAARGGPHFTPLHSSLPIEIASMKSWSC